MRAEPSRRCGATTLVGAPCQAWAVHGTEPPLCAAHAGRLTGGGAPLCNQNARRHGAYSRSLSPQDVADIVAAAGNRSLEEELASARVVLRRLMEELSQVEGLSVGQYGHLAELAFRGAGTVARLLRSMGAQSGPDGDEQMRVMDEALDELSRKWGVKLSAPRPAAEGVPTE